MAQRTGYSLDALIDSLGELAFLNKSQLYDAMYPVGICIMFDSNTNPNNTMSGTTWVQVTDGASVRAAATLSAISSVSGSDNISLAVGNMPAHSHAWTGGSGAAGGGTVSTSSDGNHSHAIATTIASNGDHAHRVYGTVSTNGDHNHTANTSCSMEGVHQHSFFATSTSAGAHTHGMPQGTNDGNGWNNNRRYTSGDDNTDQMLTTNQNQWPFTSNDGAHTHNVSGDTSWSAAHSHSISVGIANAGNHNHTFDVTSVVTGAHSHTASSSSNTTGAHSHSVVIGNHSHTISGSNANTGGGSAFSVLNKTHNYGIWKRTA